MHPAAGFARWGDEGAAFLNGLINAGLMLVGIVLDRRAFVVFGALGVNG